MTRQARKTRSRKLSRRRTAPKAPAEDVTLPLDPLLEKKKERWFAIAVAVILTVFGIYKALAIYGVYPFPNPDFPGFVRVGRQIMSFKMPSQFLRAPVVGMLQVIISWFVKDDQHFLTAGWLLNAILSVGNVLLVWLVAREIIGKSAVFLAIVTMLNPWILRSQVNPIAEITMVFFILLTLLAIFRHWWWAYLFAAIASMVRYECTALIMLAFVMDMLTRKTKQDRIKSLVLAAIASVPFLLWMLGTYLKWQPGQTHYLKHYDQEMVGMNFITMLWESAFAVLVKLPAAAKAMFVSLTSQQAADSLNAAIGALNLTTKIIAVISLLFSLFYGILKRNWKVLALWGFVILYILVHATRNNSHHRYCVPISYIVLMISWFGIQSAWQFLNSKIRMPKAAIIAAQTIVIILAVWWAASLIPSVTKSADICPTAAKLPFVAITTAVLIAAATIVIFRYRFATQTITLAAIACVMIASSHFMTARIINVGNYYLELKYMLDWFNENTEPGEKFAAKWIHVLGYMSESRRPDMVELVDIAGNNYEEFLSNCETGNITHIAFTLRGSGAARGIEHLLPYMKEPKSSRDLECVRRIQVGKRYVNIFRLRRPPGAPTRNQPDRGQ